MMVGGVIAAILLLAAAFLLWRGRRGEPAGWSIGPVVNGDNYSHGVELNSTSGTVWSVTIKPGAELDGITQARGVISGAIHARYRVTGTGLYASEQPDQPAGLTLYFQREGDDWSGVGAYQGYRWYSLDLLPLTVGEHDVTIPLTIDQWGDVEGGRSPDTFAAAMAAKGRIGVGFGWAGGRMHGVETTAPVRVEMLEFTP